MANYAGKVRSDQASAANPADFMPALAEFDRKRDPQADGPRLLADPVEHAKLMRKVLFNKDE